MKKIIKRLLIVVCCWYGLVIFCLPSLSNCRPTPSVRFAQRGINEFARDVCIGNRRFGDFDLQAFERMGYRSRFLPSENDPQFAVVVYPEVPWKYFHGYLHGILFMDWEKRRLPTMLLTREGDIYSCYEHDYSFKNVPPDSITQSIKTNPSWSRPQNIRESAGGNCVPS